MNIYGLLSRLVDGSTLNETDKKAAREVVQKLQTINAFGSATTSMQSDTDETVHTHVIETHWDGMNAGKLVDICRDCHQRIGLPYDPKYSSGNSQYFRR